MRFSNAMEKAAQRAESLVSVSSGSRSDGGYLALFQQFQEFLSFHSSVFDYLGEQPSPNILAGMNRNDGHSSIRVLQNDVTAPLSYEMEYLSCSEA